MLADNWKVDGPSYGCNVQMRVGDERMGHAIFVTGREDACEELPDAGVAKDPVEPKSPKDAQEPGGCGCEGYYELGMQKAIAAKDDALAGLANFVSEARALRRTFRGASWRLAQLLLPAALVAASMLSESVSSRLATVYYVRYMRVLEELLGDAGSQLPNPLHREWISTHHHDYPQKLQDLTASWLQEPLVVTQWFWDVTVVPLPMMALLAMFLCKHKLVYCKAALVFAALLSGRAACGLLTVVPDASGWEQCQQRLNKRGIEDMGTHAELLDFRNDFWGSLLEVLSVEVGGSRYCGDMIYSKHCFILLLSTLVINDLLGRCHGHRRCIRVVIGVLTWTYTISASFATIAARYHYSLDVFLAFRGTVADFTLRLKHGKLHLLVVGPGPRGGRGTQRRGPWVYDR
ncbi:unnamed protein product [Prorocentrum cordatum]|uniref:Sphingomyelin synthase-like domain-containing protein n=1 Tax=Prorocentrum cordatum TaxID=2364126 RepID=A0ABN9PHD7_9DINO|nr:unnamed protein product [Polarella glacialis]